MTTSNPVVIASASNDRYSMGLVVALVSALENCRGWVHHSVLIVVLDGGIQPRNWRRLEKSLDSVGVAHRVLRFKPDLSLFEGFPLDYGASYLTYARLFLPKLLPDICRILYIDSDLLIQESLQPIWETNLGDTPLAAAVCAHVETIGNENLPVEELGLIADAPYLQAGFLLIDLDVWRKMNLSERCLDYLRRYPDRAPHWDQSAINAVIDQKWTALPERWNVPAAYVEFKSGSWNAINPAVLHYSGPDKPWLYGNHTWSVAQPFFTLLDQTAWRGWRPSHLRAKLKFLKWKLHQILRAES
jgi:lipopolysaccharide biosynthesis glycosyltransferase